MACEAPPSRWLAGLLRPLSASLLAAGLLCTAFGVFLTSGLAGFLMPIGALFFLMGTSNGATTALHMGSIFNLTKGSARRIDLLTKECQHLQPLMESVAQALCADATAVRRTVSLTVTRVSEEWTAGINPMFSLFLLCRTITVARQQDTVFGDGSAFSPERQRQVINTLYRLCDLRVSEIAVMLDQTVVDVWETLNSPPDGHRP